ncbi:alpha/beta hydrolase [Cupriavidus pinatubonensis]|uniref:Carboxylesterase NlhH n=1 Tax=Cupriavidus pinatubonensis TaxID=248026 RepID=A0ABM8XRB1_9BURK|nr:alpha/beta hydrolase [Cupriavidus pinatubonensis]CAG9182849.1 Carboxylesterase NlhH [Cupriavidus pinatubonensis]
MALDQQSRYILDMIAAAGRPPLHTCTPQQARQSFDFRKLAGPPDDIARVENMAIPGPAGNLRVRVYTPDGEGPFPALVYCHGGGWVVGDLDTVDVPCRRLASRAACVVASVDYRLAPEHPFPAAAEDAYAAFQWLVENAGARHIDATRIAVGGDSAGGNLAAVVALMARDRVAPQPCFQVLLYPVTDGALDTASYRENADGYLLTRDSMVWFWNHYVSDADRMHPYASPLRAEHHRGLPPAFVVTAEFDPLRDEGEAYAHRLAAAGTPVECKRYDGTIHGFCWMPGVLDKGRQALDDTAAALRVAFQSDNRYR